jgi:hypothetical protein
MYAEKRVESKNNKFLKLFTEKEDINQYWFSESTIEFIINQITLNTDDSSKIAFVSTPSIFFSCNSQIQEKSVLFDYDDRLIKRHRNGVKFDFNEFNETVKNYLNYFDFVIIDPPYINEPSWTKFAEFARLISIKNDAKLCSKILTCSIAENKNILKNLLNLEIKNFQPSIPHLVYQYNFFANYESSLLDEINTEIIN